MHIATIQQARTPSFIRPESEALPRHHSAIMAATSPSSSVATQDEAEVCYFTAKAVPIRASVITPSASSSLSPSVVPYQNPFVQQSHFSISPCTSPPPQQPSSDSPMPQQYRAGSAHVTPSQFPPPPGHSHPSFVFRAPPTPLGAVAAAGSPLAMPSTSSSLVAVISPRMSTASSQYPVAGGRDSTLSATPSLFPQPPSANGKEAYIKPLFLGPKSVTGRSSALSTASSSVPGPTPPPKEYHPTLSPLTYDYFSPLAPTVTSVQPSPPPVAPSKTTEDDGQQQPQPSLPAATAVGITRVTKPEPLDLLSPQQQQSTRTQSSSLLPPRAHSPISPHSPVANPALSPLTMQTLTHLSHTALRSPSLTFIEPPDSAALRSPVSPANSASPLTSAQRDRLWKLKQQYDEERGYEKGMDGGGHGEMSRWSMMTRRTQMDKEKRSMRMYLLLGLGLGLLALGGIVGIIVALTVAQKGK